MSIAKKVAENCALVGATSIKNARRRRFAGHVEGVVSVIAYDITEKCFALERKNATPNALYKKQIKKALSLD